MSVCMIFVATFILTTTLIILCHAEENLQQKIEDTPESLKVTKNFRRALLDALEKLEKDEKSNGTVTENSTGKEDLHVSDFDENIKNHKIRDKTLDQETIVTSFADGTKASVLVHSFSTDTQNNKQSKSLKTIESSTYRTKTSADNVISASITSTIAGGKQQNSNINTNEVSQRKEPTIPVTPKTTLTSPSPTVSTPVEEDETKAKVEDVQFIHAPLVAAFTVEQDDKGLPRKVIPIFGNKNEQNQFSIRNQNPVRNLHTSLEEKQKLLEEQIRLLQEQRRQQELLILQQQALQRQILKDNLLKGQTNVNSFTQSIQEPNRLTIPIPHQNSVNTFHQQSFIDHKNTFNLQNKDQQHLLPSLPTAQSDVNSFLPRPTKDTSGTVISFQPSISYQQNGFTPILNQNPQFNQLHFNSQQGLPVKPAVEFQKQHNLPINQLPIHLTQQQVPNQLRDHIFNNNVNNDIYLQDFLYRQRTLVPPPLRGNRVFRQEAQVGNFGSNEFSSQFQHRFNPTVRYNNFNTVKTNFNTNTRNHFFNNPGFHQANVDNRLKNLIYQSGLGQGHAQEDFNIISKVLALDHTGNYQQNSIFAASNISERKIPFKT